MISTMMSSSMCHLFLDVTSDRRRKGPWTVSWAKLTAQPGIVSPDADEIRHSLIRARSREGVPIQSHASGDTTPGHFFPNNAH